MGGRGIRSHLAFVYKGNTLTPFAAGEDSKALQEECVAGPRHKNR